MHILSHLYLYFFSYSYVLLRACAGASLLREPLHEPLREIACGSPLHSLRGCIFCAGWLNEPFFIICVFVFPWRAREPSCPLDTGAGRRYAEGENPTTSDFGRGLEPPGLRLWMNECMNEWNEQTNDRTNEWMTERYERMKWMKWVNAIKRNEWNEWMHAWMNAWMKDW